jgi:hypothetical protein
VLGSRGRTFVGPGAGQGGTDSASQFSNSFEPNLPIASESQRVALRRCSNAQDAGPELPAGA